MDPRIRKTLNHIEKNLELAFTLKELAQIACLSSSQFHRVFKKETKRTPNQFIEEIKLNKAYQLLISGNITVQKLSLSLGYNDYETFSRAFKRLFKLSPDDFKSIIGKLKNEVCNEGDQIILAPIDSEDEFDLDEKVKELAKSFNISKDQLMISKTYKIEKKSNVSVGSSLLIKNKFTLTEDQRIWELLLKEN